VCPSCGSLVGVNDERCYTCGRSNPGLWGFGPLLRRVSADFSFAPLVIGVSAALYAATLLVTVVLGGNIGTGGMFSLLAPSQTAMVLFGASGAYPMFARREWWTIFSASWLHAGALHILFNMLWVRDLGPATVDVYGPARTTIVYVVSGACGFLLSSFAGNPLTLGASASIFGMLGALVHYGRLGSSQVRSQALGYAVVLFAFGFIMPGVDNFAHAGGFAGGYAASAVLNPHTRERGDHVIIAIICLAITALAVVLSILSGLGII